MYYHLSVSKSHKTEHVSNYSDQDEPFEFVTQGECDI